MAMAPLAVFPPGLVQSQTHSYAYGGLYIATVTIANGFDKYEFNHSLIVYGKIDNITLITNSPVPFISGMGVAELRFSAPMPPVNVQLLFTYGDGTFAHAHFSTAAETHYRPYIMCKLITGSAVALLL